MNFLRISHGNRKNGGLSLVIVIVLLVLYMAGVVEISSLHSSVHAQDVTELHSAANEDNACHQNVYHNKKDENCDHKSHIVSLKKCPLCQLTIQSFQIYTPGLSTGIFINVEELHFADDDTLSIAVGQLLPSRAPPTV